MPQAATLATAMAPPPKARGAFNVERVTWLRHWTPDLFSLRTTVIPASASPAGSS